MRRRTPLPLVALIIAASTSFGLSRAMAQQQRDTSGRALDRNPQVGSAGLNTRVRDVRDQIWFNNQIITGNAPAGRSFRGYVGYTAPSDFRGGFDQTTGRSTIGSDALYDFRRDSTSGAAVATGVRASDALRYQMDLTTGQSAPSYLAGAYFTPRDSRAATGNAVTASSGESALRSTADYLSSRTLRPTFVGSRTDPNGAEWNATASNLIGLNWMRVNTGVNTEAGAPALPAAPSADPLAALANTKPVTPGAPDQPPAPGSAKPSVTPGAPPSVVPQPTPVPAGPRGFQDLTPTGLEARAGGFHGKWELPAEGNRLDNGVNNAVDSSAVPARSVAHARAIEALNASIKPAATPAGAEGADAGGRTRSAAERELDRLRRVLRGLPPEPPAKPSTESAAAATPPKPSTNPAAKPGDASPPPAQDGPSPEILRALKSLGEKRLDSLTPSVEAQTDPKIYRAHMEAGQRAIVDGRYFDAEDRFTRAIASMPSDPMAKIGRVHAELGAGMFLSASTNLRRVIADSPEVTGLRFDAKLMPASDRVKVVAAQLREEIDRGSTGLGLETSLLLAYLGRATGDQAMTDEGLRAMAERQPANSPVDVSLLKTLQTVWGSGR